MNLISRIRNRKRAIERVSRYVWAQERVDAAFEAYDVELRAAIDNTIYGEFAPLPKPPATWQQGF